ncbi:hypothetical protein EJ04DRAFT_593979 [Polyplosphaeria fusca]|uniref:Uncharacterized protein n=1 Tax=Polyplosphaeria fusca TaxID=682080 RepID=A0A9P4UV18_9PLEO|nr:hypothetical protein EJ04DRAFT_593979 [Polyplosphaeria fusca]
MAHTATLVLSCLSFARFGFAGVPAGLDGTLQPRDVFPGASDLLSRDFDIVRTEIDGDEDVIYLQRRGNPLAERDRDDGDSCSDCSGYTPWDYSMEELAELAEDEMDEVDEALDERSLQMRGKSKGGKKTKSKEGVCMTTYLGAQIGGFNIESPPYPNNGDYENGKKKPIVFDFFPYDKPQQQSYWDLGVDDKFQYRPVVTRGTKKIRNLAVSIEHILEWNTFLQFINCETSSERCLHFAKWFGKEIGIETTLTVQKWKMDGSADGQAEQKQVTGQRMKGIDWITRQYPGTKATSYYEHEFVSLHDDVNGRKMAAWDGKDVVRKEDMEMNLDNKYKRDGDPQRKANIDKNQGLCDASRKMRDVLAVYEYHKHPLIMKIMKAQADRIGAALEYVEHVLETTGIKPQGSTDDVPVEMDFQNQQDPDPKNWNTVTEQYTRMTEGSLKSQWEDFLTEKWKDSKDTLENFLAKWMPKLDGAKTVKRGVGDTFSTQCGMATAKELKDRKDFLRAAITKATQTPWTNWFL